MNNNRVLVIGLGQLGLPVANYVKEKGFNDVYGYDISRKAIDRAEKTAGIKKATDFSDFDVYVVCVSTHKPGDIFSPYIGGLLSVIERISKSKEEWSTCLNREYYSARDFKQSTRNTWP